jgi:multimeric flavodoxin WrbA
VVLSALREHDVATEMIRLVDYRIEPGVVSEAVIADDEWPWVHARLVSAEILVIAMPTWLGQPSSVAKRALERMNAMLSETADDSETPIAYNRVAGVVVTANEDGAHHVINEAATGLSTSATRFPVTRGPTGTRAGTKRRGVVDNRLVDPHRPDGGTKSIHRRHRAAGSAAATAGRVAGDAVLSRGSCL